MKTYELEFLPGAGREWNKLGPDVRKQFAKKLQQLLVAPRVPSARLRELPDCYKIKLRSAGYRLIYRVFDDRIVVQVIAVGKRERDEVYKDAAKRVV
ncbi:MAG: type II toxin-antitoxin system RelE/ParE family toxin [Sphingorhabdus sp.]